MDYSKRTPIGNHSQHARVKLWKIGDGRAATRKPKAWYKGLLLHQDGVNFGPYYHIKGHAVGPRVRDGAGYTETAPHELDKYEPVQAYANGWQPMSTLPKEWEDVNKKAEKKRAKYEAARRETPEHISLMQQMQKTVQKLSDVIEGRAVQQTQIGAGNA